MINLLPAFIKWQLFGTIEAWHNRDALARHPSLNEMELTNFQDMKKQKLLFEVSKLMEFQICFSFYKSVAFDFNSIRWNEKFLNKSGIKC